MVRKPAGVSFAFVNSDLYVRVITRLGAGSEWRSCPATALAEAFGNVEDFRPVPVAYINRIEKLQASCNFKRRGVYRLIDAAAKPVPELRAWLTGRCGARGRGRSCLASRRLWLREP